MPLFKLFDEEFWQLRRWDPLKVIWHSASSPPHDFDPHDLARSPLYEGNNLDEFLEEQEARRILRKILSRNLKNGWICPAGNFYSCHDLKHVTLLEDAMSISAIDAEDEGWLKVGATYWQTKGCKPITDEQKRTLVKIGRSHKPDEHGIHDPSREYKTAYPKGNQAMDALYAKYEAVIKNAPRKPVAVTPEQVFQYL